MIATSKNKMARSGSERAFENQFEDYKGQIYINQDGKLESKHQESILQAVGKLQTLLSAKVKDDGRDDTVYTGTPGQALLCLQLYLKLSGQDVRHLHKAMTWLKPWLNSRNPEISFMCGASGPLAIAAVVSHYLGDDKASKAYVSRLEGLAHAAETGDFPDELLYGRCGYLSSLLFIQRHLGGQAVQPRTITQVVNKVLSSGSQTAKHNRLSFPLMYTWLGEPYLGAAHGLAGIYYVLLQVQEPSVQAKVREMVRPCLDFLLTQRHPSGNGFPAMGEGQERDKLVHWCHGAPGWVQLYCLAHKIYGDPKYLAAAEACGRVVWQRGLLRKGYGLCHGAAGNAYTFTCLYQHTGEPRYLHHALKFADWCCDFGSHGCRTPDRPWSLFEGLAGTAYFLADMLEPGKAAFPTYDLL